MMSTQEERKPDEFEPSTLRRLLTGDLPLESETAAFILVNVIDFIMTYWLMATGSFRERNPIAAYFLNHWGPFKGMLFYKLSLVVFVCIVAQLVAMKNLESARILLRVGTVVAVGVVLYSAWLYSGHVLAPLPFG